MPITIQHSLTATTPDDPSFEIRPSHWNESHVATVNLSNNEVIKWAAAGTNSISSGTLSFSNAGNVTFGMDANGVITATANAAGAGDGFNILAAGSQTANTTGTVLFNNSNGITFGMSNSSVITASHNGLTTAMASNRGSDFVQATAAFAGTSASGTIASNGISVSIGPYITTAMLSNAATISNIKVSAGTLSANRSDLTFANSNGISFGLETNGVVTGTVATNYLTTAMLSNAATISNIKISAGTLSANRSDMTFADSNGISFGLNTNGVVTGTVKTDYLTTARASNDAIGLNTALTAGPLAWTVNSAGLSLNAGSAAGTTSGFAGANISGSITHNTAGINLSLSVAAPGAAAENNNHNLLGANTAGNTTASGSTIGLSGINMTLSGTNGSVINLSVPATSSLSATGIVSISTNGSTISVGASIPPQSSYLPPWAFSGMATNSSLGQNTLYFQPFEVYESMSASRINFYLSLSGAMSAGNSTGTCYVAAGYALYTLNSVSLSLLTSYSMSIIQQSMSSNTQYAATHYNNLSDATSHSTSQYAVSNANASTYLTSSVNGLRAVAFPVNQTLSGRYWLGFSVSTVTGNAMTNNVSVAQTSVGVQPAIAAWGTSSVATNASVMRAVQGWGTYSATSAAWPNSIAYTTDHIRAPVNQTLIHFGIYGNTIGTNRIA